MHSIFSTYPNEMELLKACRILFGSVAEIDHCFLENLQVKELKSTYRSRAMDTHPDRLLSLGSFSPSSSAPFIEISQAYEKLNYFLKERSKFKRYHAEWKAFHPKEKPSGTGTQPSSFSGKSSFHQTAYSSPYPHQSYAFRQPSLHRLPHWELKLGEYLFYSGLITWGDLISAILWQRSHRPLFGQIALHWNWISPERLHHILLRKTCREKTGELMMRYGVISSFQKAMLLRHQKQCQPLLGQYFVRSGRFLEYQVNIHIQMMSHHNLQITSAKRQKTGSPLY